MVNQGFNSAVEFNVKLHSDIILKIEHINEMNQKQFILLRNKNLNAKSDIKHLEQANHIIFKIKLQIQQLPGSLSRKTPLGQSCLYSNMASSLLHKNFQSLPN